MYRTSGGENFNFPPEPSKERNFLRGTSSAPAAERCCAQSNIVHDLVKYWRNTHQLCMVAAAVRAAIPLSASYLPRPVRCTSSATAASLSSLWLFRFLDSNKTIATLRACNDWCITTLAAPRQLMSPRAVRSFYLFLPSYASIPYSSS